MADYSQSAARMIELGQKEARLMRQLMRVQADRCKLLQAHGTALGIAPDLAARGAEPKHR